MDTLTRRWESLRAQQPGLRARDAARALHVTEAEFVAAGCAGPATRLRPAWVELLAGLEAAGEVMALTRNEHAVLEIHGAYRNVSARGPMGLVLGGAIDLRLLLGGWSSALALEEPGRDGPRRSLQVFDAHGTAVHKVYATPRTDAAVWAELVSRFADPAPAPLSVTPAPPHAPERPDAEVDAAGLRSAWLALKDTHDFFPLLRRFGVGRVQALRLAGAELAWRVAPGAHRTVLEQAARDGLPIMIFVGSLGCIEIHTGTVGNVKATEGWFNVLDPALNLHLREAGLADAWVVRKPTADGVVTALEVYDAAGAQVVQFFGARKPGTPELAAWRALAESLSRAG
jgi:putative hemin transport protein